MKLRGFLSAMALSAGLCAFCPTSFAQITGKVTADGTPPDPKEITMNDQCKALHKDPVYDETWVVGDKGELANVIVSIKPAEGQTLKGEIPKGPAVLDQKGCMYSPHVLPIMVGQKFIVANSDTFMHNVHAFCLDNAAFNKAQPVKDDQPGMSINPLKVEEAFQVKCDVHPWMIAWIKSYDHPYFAASKEDGTYSIDTSGLKDGTYTLVAWHEPNQEVEKTGVVVKNGKATGADFKIPVKGK